MDWIKIKYYEWKYKNTYNKTPLGVANTIVGFGFHKNQKNMRRYKKMYKPIYPLIKLIIKRQK